MKNHLLVIPFCLLVFVAEAQVNWGIKAGVNFANEKHSGDDYYEYEHSYLTGLAIGTVLEIPVIRNFMIRPELLFSMKGSNSEGYYAVIQTDEKNSSQLSYLELPVNFVYKIGRFQFFAGPYAAVFLGGRLKVEYGSGRNTVKGGVLIRPTNDVDQKTTTGWRKHFDCGIQFGTGFNLSDNLVVTGCLGLGLENTRPKFFGEEYDGIVRNRTINLSLSYFVCR